MSNENKPMSNNQLPADVESRLDAAVKRRSLSHDYASGYKEGYIAGATAENERNETMRLQLEAQNANVEILLAQKNDLIERAQKLADTLEWIKTYGPCDDRTVKFIDKALQGWEGEKEVEKFTQFALECAITAIPLSVLKSDGEYFKAGDGKRFVAFRWDKDENNARISIREDGDTRFVFNGVVTSVEDFKKAWQLTILY